ncbi:MAG TPA: nucleotidyltransferase family protein [Candidatus Woesebacteria bacterium]|jgi:predicted nucleotidyltransferase|nr:nucleotidyltransferase family protein [Candidatus Woesebacteria bacterium]
MTPQIITKHLSEINKIVEQNDINYLAVYGSFARGEETPNSDLDLLVSFSKSKGLFDFIGIQDELSSVLKVKVDLVTKNGLSKYIKPYVENDIKIIYEEKT